MSALTKHLEAINIKGCLYFLFFKLLKKISKKTLYGSPPTKIIGLPSANTVAEPPVVTAEQCASHPFDPQQGCGVTGLPGGTTPLPFTNTVAAPCVAIPPAEFASPLLTTAGI